MRIMHYDFINCFAKMFNLIRFILKNNQEHLFLSCQTIKQDQLCLKHLYKLPVRTKNCINKLNEALTHFSLFKENEDNKNRVSLLENVCFGPAIVTCYVPCKRSSLLSCAYILCNLQTWKLMYSEQTYTKFLNSFVPGLQQIYITSWANSLSTDVSTEVIL